MIDPYTLYATDAEITELQTRWRAAVNPQAHPPKDCRTCARCYATKGQGVYGCDSIVACVNGNRYQPTAYVQLWGKK